MEEKIREIIESIHAGIDLDDGKKLVDDKVLDSFDIIALVAALNDAFDIEISVMELSPENFNSVSAIAALVSELS